MLRTRETSYRKVQVKHTSQRAAPSTHKHPNVRYKSNIPHTKLGHILGKHPSESYKSNTPRRELDQVPVKHPNVRYK